MIPKPGRSKDQLGEVKGWGQEAKENLQLHVGLPQGSPVPLLLSHEFTEHWDWEVELRLHNIREAAEADRKWRRW